MARKRFYARLLTVVAAGFVGLAQLAGQSINGSVTGLVTDQTGAVISAASVTLRNTRTNLVSRMDSNESGLYSFLSVPIGDYELKVEAKGFKTAVIRSLAVETAQTVRADLRLEISDASETVQVTAEAPLIQSETSSFGTQVSRQMLANLPLSLASGIRDPISFITLTPGVSGGSSVGSGMRITGSRGLSNEVLVDGMPMNYNARQNVPDISRPAFETVAEFRVEATVAPAEFGRTAGGVVMLASKSGTNQLHGNLVSFFRNNVLDARRYNTAQADLNRQAEFSGSLGAPVVIPHLYNGKDRTFVFLNYTGFRFARQNLGATATVPTSLMRSGDFSANPERIFDPLTAAANGARQQFPNNTIPSSRISGLSKRLLDVVPLPTGPGFATNFQNPDPAMAVTNTDTGYVRLDHSLNDNHRLGGTWRYQDYRRKTVQGPMPKISDEATDFPLTQSAVISDDLVLRPNLVNHFQVGALRFTLLSLYSQDIGVQVPGAFKAGFPAIRFSGQGFTAFGYLNNRVVTNLSLNLQDSLSWTTGKHNFKFGGRLDRYRFNSRTRNNNEGTYTFSQFATSQPGVTRTGNSFAGFLLGSVNNATMAMTDPYGEASTYIGLYAQDDWKLTSRLTLNYGLRWETQVPFAEVAGRASIMDPDLPNPGAGGRPGAMLFAGNGQGMTGHKGFISSYLNAWGPRLGIAYRVGSSTVLRAGAGLFYSPLIGDGLLRQGYASNISLTTQDGGLTPVFLLDSGWPSSAVRIPPFIDPTVSNGQGTSMIEKGRGGSGRLARTSQWQFGVQHSLKGILLEATYAGTVAHGIANNALVQVNQLNPSYLSLGALLTRPITDPAVAAAGFSRPYTGFTGSLAQSLRMFPQYADVDTINTPTGNSTYHALLLKSQKRFSNGLQFLVSYAFSKTLTDVSFTPGELNAPQDQYNRRAEKSIADVDVPQRLIATYSYDLPFGKGGRWLTSGLAGRLAGGWTVAGIHRFEAGSPLRITTPNGLPIFNGHLRPNRVGGVPIAIGPGRGSFEPLNGPAGQQGDLYLDRNAFSTPAAYTLGNLGYFLPDVRGFGTINEDLSLAKRIEITERYSVQFRADLFNAFNRRNLNNPVSDLTNANFGRINGQNAPRVMQFGFRFDF
ncbi:MAG: TonB-dependent receptor [Bryobacterales bacterium]|nr:TonB-dependent receptor [Bryobacterales bacterium]